MATALSAIEGEILPPVNQEALTVPSERSETALGLKWTSYSGAQLDRIVRVSVSELTALSRKGQKELRERLLPALQEVRRRLKAGQSVDGYTDITDYLESVGLSEGVIRKWEFRLREKELRELTGNVDTDMPGTTIEVGHTVSEPEPMVAPAALVPNTPDYAVEIPAEDIDKLNELTCLFAKKVNAEISTNPSNQKYTVVLSLTEAQIRLIAQALKAKEPTVVHVVETIEPAPKRGRPKGSKNKPKTQEPTVVVNTVEPQQEPMMGNVTVEPLKQEPMMVSVKTGTWSYYSWNGEWAIIDTNYPTKIYDFAPTEQEARQYCAKRNSEVA
jgi:hypothetical protein